MMTFPGLNRWSPWSNHLFQDREIIEEAAASFRSEAAIRLRAVALVAFADFHQPGFLEHLQVAAQITIGEAAKLFEIGKSQPLRVRDQRGEHTQPRFFVNDAVKPLVREGRTVNIGLRHRISQRQSTLWLR